MALACGALASPANGQCALERVVASDGLGNDRFGYAVAIDGDTLAVGARDEAVTGAAYVYERTGGDWLEVAKLTPEGFGGTADFGEAVALSGDTLLVGAPGLQDGGLSDGGVFVYERRPAGWVQTDVLRQATLAPDRFGAALDLDGDRAVVGAPRTLSSAATPGGAVHVFERSAGAWSETALVTLDWLTAFEEFGTSVALSGDRLLVGMVRNVQAVDASGRAYAFEASGAAWTLAATFAGTSGAVNDEFGRSVALDGRRGLIGAPRAACDAGAGACGAVVEVEQGQNGWSVVGRLAAPEPEAEDLFGRAVALGGDLAAVGANGDDGFAADVGAVHTFVRESDAWRAGATVAHGDAEGADGFGWSVATDGASVAVGAAFEQLELTDEGAVYLWSRADSGCLLYGWTPVVAASEGGDLPLRLAAGPERAGDAYLVLGSTGTEPGVDVGGALLPLAPSAYLDLTLTSAATPLLVDTFGRLDADGEARPALRFPPLPAAAATLGVLHHAAIVLPLGAGPAEVLTSVAVPLALEP